MIRAKRAEIQLFCGYFKNDEVFDECIPAVKLNAQLLVITWRKIVRNLQEQLGTGISTNQQAPEYPFIISYCYAFYAGKYSTWYYVV
ncbi:hypothetical protein D3C86_1593930 [compost metagenome]